MSRQLLVLQFIKNYIEDEGWAPTVREIMPIVGLASTSAVAYHISNLVDAGLLIRGESKARALKITKEGNEALMGWLANLS